MRTYQFIDSHTFYIEKTLFPEKFSKCSAFTGISKCGSYYFSHVLILLIFWCVFRGTAFKRLICSKFWVDTAKDPKLKELILCPLGWVYIDFFPFTLSSLKWIGVVWKKKEAWQTLRGVYINWLCSAHYFKWVSQLAGLTTHWRTGKFT